MSRFTLSWKSTSAERYDQDRNRLIDAAVTDLGLTIIDSSGGTLMIGPEPRSDNSFTVETDITTAVLLRAALARVIGKEIEEISFEENDRSWDDKPPVVKLDITTLGELPEKQEGDFTYGHSPDEIAQDNYRRATFASVGLQAYGQATRSVEEDIPTVFSDLLGDLRHLADCLGLDFEELSERGQHHYLPETKGEF